MSSKNKISNGLINETSPYLQQHAYNPVAWYPWSDVAFDKAKEEDKPVFLSIGYSTCHWCHVMAHESFEDAEVAKILNESFIAIKVDKEERPDIDNIYMTACQAFTGSGGWPLTAIMTSDQKPFFVGTYLPKVERYGTFGLIDLLNHIKHEWQENREALLSASEKVTKILTNQSLKAKRNSSESLVDDAIESFFHTFDKDYGGFGRAPKFPVPHNMLFLLKHFENSNDNEVLHMVEKTLTQMYKGGIFDHIGFGFSRYSTDRYWLIPHFEKMLYDNALLTIVYLEAYEITKNELYKIVAEKIMQYVLKELYSEDGGFFCAEDADSDGIEGKFYAFSPEEIIDILGKNDGKYFNDYFDIKKPGNFEGRSIPNLIDNKKIDIETDQLLPKIYDYRKNRNTLHKDDKQLASWNALMIVAFSKAYRILGDEEYLKIADKASKFIEKNLMDGNRIFTSTRKGKRTNHGFLDDYSFYIYAQIELYQVTLDKTFLEKASYLTQVVIEDFFDHKDGGFYLYDRKSEQLILKPKEIYDGAIPSGNSVMTYNLIKLTQLGIEVNTDILNKQIAFMSANVIDGSLGSSFFLYAILCLENDNKKIICVLKDKKDFKNQKFPKGYNITIMEEATSTYPLLNNRTTYYICEQNKCLPPTNDIIISKN